LTTPPCTKKPLISNSSATKLHAAAAPDRKSTWESGTREARVQDLGFKGSGFGAYRFRVKGLGLGFRFSSSSATKLYAAAAIDRTSTWESRARETYYSEIKYYLPPCLSCLGKEDKNSYFILDRVISIRQNIYMGV
jgi:hypothetical protein